MAVEGSGFDHGAPEEVRARLALALDVAGLDDARALAAELRPWFGVAKVGLELFTAAGPQVVMALREDGFDVFVDLKLLDIPTTVFRAARVAGTLGARYLTVHTRAGVEHLAAGVEGLSEGARAAGVPDPVCLGITVLTSEPRDDGALSERVGTAISAGCGGVVCAAVDLATVRAIDPTLRTVVPGIRPAGVNADDQVRVATPSNAVNAGADLLVIGRAVTHADDRRAAAAGVAREVATASTVRDA